MTNYIADKYSLPSFTWPFILVNSFLTWFCFETEHFLFLIILICFNVAIIITYLNRYQIRQISVGDNLLEVQKKNLLGRFSLEKYSFEKMDFIYREGKLGLRRHYNRPNCGNILTVYIANNSIFELEPYENGWTDSLIYQLAIDFKKRGLKQFFDKYDNRDVVLPD
ncbi:MAG: hypothetical protein ACXVAY_12280 [Mucilaginibacter sp.]